MHIPDKETTDAASTIVWWVAVLGGMASAFVGGIVSATWAVATKIKKYEKEVELARTEVAEIKSVCVLVRGQCRAEMANLILEAMNKFTQEWGNELAGSRQQRIDQAATLGEIKDSVIRIHQRIDNNQGAK